MHVKPHLKIGFLGSSIYDIIISMLFLYKIQKMLVSFHWEQIAAFCGVYSLKRLILGQSYLTKPTLSRLLFLLLFYFIIVLMTQGSRREVTLPWWFPCSEKSLIWPCTTGVKLVQRFLNWVSSNQAILTWRKHPETFDFWKPNSEILSGLLSHPMSSHSEALACLLCSSPSQIYSCICLYDILIIWDKDG